MNAPFRPPAWASATQTDALEPAIGIGAWLCIMALVWIGGLWWALA